MRSSFNSQGANSAPRTAEKQRNQSMKSAGSNNLSPTRNIKEGSPPKIRNQGMSVPTTKSGESLNKSMPP